MPGVVLRGHCRCPRETVVGQSRRVAPGMERKWKDIFKIFIFKTFRYIISDKE